MAGQYDLPRKTPMTPGVPPVSPSSRAAHEMLDQTLGALVQKMAPHFASMLPADKAKQTLREVMKNGSFLEKQLVASKIGPYLPKGVTAADLDKAVNEAPPAAEKPPAATAPAAPAAPAAAAAAPAAPVAPAGAPAAPAAASPAADVIAPPAAAAKGPTRAAAAAQPSGSSAALDYLAKYGGHASVLKDGRIVPVHPGTAGSYKTPNPEFAARLHAAGQAFERETGKTPKYGEMSRGEDVQGVYYNRYKSGEGGIAAAPGRSRHQGGEAADLPDSDFRKWLYAGNKDRFGLHFPVKGDAPHVQMNPAFKGQLATGTGAAQGTPDASVQAGAGPAAVAAARARDTAPASAPSSSSGKGYFPQGTSPETVAAVNALAAKLGVSPAAVAGVIKTESGWNPGAVSPGGKYQGLTQIGPDTFKEAGGRLGGLSYEEYLKATPDKQVAAYGDWLDHYKFADKAKAAGVDFSKLSPAQQAAHLQAFQFSPAVADWQGGDPNKPVTASKQASGLGSTSLADMTKYYEKLLKDTEGGSAPLDPTPNVGSGQSDYDRPMSFPAVDPTPNVGSGASDYGSGGALAAATSPAANSTDYGKGAGDIFSGLGDIFAKGPVAQNAARPSGPANAPLPSLPVPPGIQPIVDPRQAEMQRQMLAAAMQRLNSGRLV